MLPTGVILTRIVVRGKRDAHHARDKKNLASLNSPTQGTAKGLATTTQVGPFDYPLYPISCNVVEDEIYREKIMKVAFSIPWAKYSPMMIVGVKHFFLL